MSQDFTGRCALVTGGSRGIAAELARALAAHGATVAVSFSEAADERIGRHDAARELVSEICNRGGKAVAVEQDLMLDGGGSRLVAQAEAQIGAIDTLLLSASVQYHLPFLSQTSQDVTDQLRINILSNIEILQAVMPQMAINGYGRILTLGSIQEVSPSPEMPIYAMSKSAMKNLVENLAVQAAGQGVILNNIAPGLIETDRNAFRRSDPEAWNRMQSRANPVGRAGQPSDLTALALHLLSPANSFTTGATIYSTGGAHIPLPAGDTQPRLRLPGDA